MNESPNETAIREAVEKSAPYCVDMITGWIQNSIIGNDFIVTKIANAEFTFNNNDSMLFTADIEAHTGKELNIVIKADMLWEKNEDKFTRRFYIKENK